MDPALLAAKPTPVSGGFVQYSVIALAILVPVIWKLYVANPAFRYQARMFLYMCWLFLTSCLIIPFALKDPFNPDNTRTVGSWLMMKVLRIKEVFGYTLIKRGQENFKVKGDGPFIVISNHQSSLDLIREWYMEVLSFPAAAADLKAVLDVLARQIEDLAIRAGRA